MKPRARRQPLSSASPLGRLALGLLTQRRRAPDGVVFVARDEARAERLGAVLHAFDPGCGALVLPRFDTLPFEELEPSREIAGRRASVLRRLAERKSAPLLIATVDALLPRVPPPRVWVRASLRIAAGDQVDPAAFAERLAAAGYDLDEAADYPGGAMFHGQAIELFPAGALAPVRIEHADGTVQAIHAYQLDRQSEGVTLENITVDPMSERSLMAAGAKARKTGVAIFDYLGSAMLIGDADVPARAEARLAAIDSSEVDAQLKAAAFLDRRAWQAATKAMIVLLATSDDDVPPRFCEASSPRRTLREFVAGCRTQGARVIFTAATTQDLGKIERIAGETTRRLDWARATRAPATAASSVLVDLDAGFRFGTKRPTVVISAADVLGSRARHLQPMARQVDGRDDIAMPVLGGAVVHLQRGLAILDGLEQVTSPGVADREIIRLRFARDETALCDVAELGLIWPYASEPGDLKLDSADGASWSARRGEAEREVAHAATALSNAVMARRSTSAPKISPPGAAYERFVAQFPYFATPDQTEAVEDVLRDLASGRPMDRIVCGDVGFGKTEVALRAAAAVVLSGQQVAVVVPTTVLARQHLQTFKRRFAALGADVGQLSRLTSAADARELKHGLRDGSVAVAIGTHALAGKDIGFADLGLVIIDEEQHFGAAEKAKLAALRDGVHTLTMSATPIPRTLASALAGIREISIIATPPVQRVPVVTKISPPSDSTLAIALRREHRRRGQSFVICPRIRDLEPLRQQLARCVPELRVTTLHGRMPAAEIDDRMIQFVGGHADVLLATNIVENGLDIPRANTIVVCSSERFGLAQLHQLRGRVGRGGTRAYAYLLTGDHGEDAQKRLEALQQLSRPGAGFEISARDLDLRGAGDLLSGEQAGHVQVFGPALYHHLLAQAVQGKLQPVDEVWSPELHLAVPALLPASYIQDEAVRLELYTRLAKAETAAAVEELDDEIQLRFGPPPGEVVDLIALAALRLECVALQIARLDVGPSGIAATLRDERVPSSPPLPITRHKQRLVLKRPVADGDQLAAAQQFIALLQRRADSGS